VAASRPAKSPRDNEPFRPVPGLRQSRRSLNHWASAVAGPFLGRFYRMETRRLRQTGILPDTGIAALFESGALATPRPLDKDQIQPASLDLRLGEKAWRVRASFLPGPTSKVADKLDRLKLHEIDLADGAVLETGCVYIVPLLESLNLPGNISASANPKSSTGRLDIFTRVMTDNGREFDKIPAGYCGPLYLEVSPRTFPIVARTGSRLSDTLSHRQCAAVGRRARNPPSRRDAGRHRAAEHLGRRHRALDRSAWREGQPDRLPRQASHRACRCRQARCARGARLLGAAL
jgi:deoxycytidine triphosphate deaminase